MPSEKGRWRRWFEGTRLDVRCALRLFWKERWFTLSAVGSVALGLSIFNTTFAVVNGALLRPLPFEHPDRLISIGLTERGRRFGGASPSEYPDLARATSLAGLAAFREEAMVLSEEGHAPERVIGAFITTNAFDLLGVRPVIGRLFRSEDDHAAAAPVVLVSEALWARRYARRSDVVGQAVRVDGVLATVVGVLPFGFPGMSGSSTAVWRPLSAMSSAGAEGQGARALGLVGRLAEGSSLEQARQELGALGVRLEEKRGTDRLDIAADVRPLRERYVPSELAHVAWLLFAAGAIALAIACINVSNLLVARAPTRFHEIAIRLAVGASRWRLIRQVLVESGLLAVGAAVVAFGLSIVGIRLFASSIVATTPPFWARFDVDWRVLLFLASMTVCSSIVVGLTPAFFVSRQKVQDHLQQGPRTGRHGFRGRRWIHVMVAAELALTIVLLAGAGLVTRAFFRLYGADLGFDGAPVTVARVDLSGPQYQTPRSRVQLFAALEERFRGSAVADGIAVSTSPPGAGNPQTWSLSVDDKQRDPTSTSPTVAVIGVGDDYFKTLDLALLAGRPFEPSDGTTGRETAIVNAHFAALHLGAGPVVGRRIKVDRAGSAPQSSGWMTIIGVAPTIRQRNALLQSGPEPIVYLPYRAVPAPTAVLVTRSQLDAGVTARELRAHLLALDPDLALFEVTTLEALLASFRWPQRVFGGMLTVIAVVALGLGAVGLYGIVAYGVAQRRREIGVRLALGARRAQVLALILKSAVATLVLGSLFGVTGALATGSLLTALLVDIQPRDPVTLLGAIAVLMMAGVAASILPAWRATRIDPALAIRSE